MLSHRPAVLLSCLLAAFLTFLYRHHVRHQHLPVEVHISPSFSAGLPFPETTCSCAAPARILSPALGGSSSPQLLQSRPPSSWLPHCCCCARCFRTRTGTQCRLGPRGGEVPPSGSGWAVPGIPAVPAGLFPMSVSRLRPFSGSLAGLDSGHPNDTISPSVPLSLSCV